jgi:hypothetical protein
MQSPAKTGNLLATTKLVPAYTVTAAAHDSSGMHNSPSAATRSNQWQSFPQITTFKQNDSPCLPLSSLAPPYSASLVQGSRNSSVPATEGTLLANNLLRQVNFHRCRLHASGRYWLDACTYPELGHVQSARQLAACNPHPPKHMEAGGARRLVTVLLVSCRA